MGVIGIWQGYRSIPGILRNCTPKHPHLYEFLGMDLSVPRARGKHIEMVADIEGWRGERWSYEASLTDLSPTPPHASRRHRDSRARTKRARPTARRTTGGGSGITTKRPRRPPLRACLRNCRHYRRHHYPCSLRWARGARALLTRLRSKGSICASCDRSVRARNWRCATPLVYSSGWGRGL
jgi:hypothetical protein